jgi:hypothetical protein
MRTYPELEKRRVKKNGFYWPPHLLQVSAYLVLGIQLLVTYLCMGPVFGSDTKVHFMVICGVLQIAVAVLGFLTTKSDPTDPAVYAHRRAMALR